ncbi:MAG: AAA family ATPase [Thermodesulfobacteriota bacterium]|nr:AAA family ATPase [Thermodesulfobacteriota bacterium]
MYMAFYNLNSKPFQISSDPSFLWLGEKHREALATLRYGVLDNKGFLLLTGDVGTGKTTLINALINSLGEDVICITVPDPSLDRLNFYNYIAAGFGMDREITSKGMFLVQFRYFLQQADANNKTVVLIIDESQLLTQELLEEIRLLSNIERVEKKLLNIFFVGQNEFNEILSRPQNRAVRQRLTLNYNIEPLTSEEVKEYIEYRLNAAGSGEKIFTQAAIQDIHFYSRGFPRRINILCDHALLTGYVREKKKIDSKIIHECARELNIPAPRKKPGVSWKKDNGNYGLDAESSHENTYENNNKGSLKSRLENDRENSHPNNRKNNKENNRENDKENIRKTKTGTLPPESEAFSKARQPRKGIRRFVYTVLFVLLVILSVVFFVQPQAFHQVFKNKDQYMARIQSILSDFLPVESEKQRKEDHLSPAVTAPLKNGKDKTDKEKLSEAVTKKIEFNSHAQKHSDNAADLDLKEAGGTPDVPGKKHLTDLNRAQKPDIVPGRSTLPGEKTLPSPYTAPDEKAFLEQDLAPDERNVLAQKTMPGQETILGQETEPDKITIPGQKTIPEQDRLAETTNDHGDRFRDTEKPELPEKPIVVRFKYNTYELNDKGLEDIDGFVRILSHYPDAEISVKGYTDAFGNPVYNKKLSEFRANIVKTFLLGKGVAPGTSKSAVFIAHFLALV